MEPNEENVPQYLIFSDAHIINKEDFEIFKTIIDYGISRNAEIYFLGDIGVVSFEGPTVEAIELVTSHPYKDNIHMLSGNHDETMRNFFHIMRVGEKYAPKELSKIEHALGSMDAYEKEAITPHFYAVHDAFSVLSSEKTKKIVDLTDIIIKETSAATRKNRLAINKMTVSGTLDEFVEGQNLKVLMELKRQGYNELQNRTNRSILTELYKKLSEFGVNLSFFAGHEHNIDKDTTFLFNKCNGKIFWDYLTADNYMTIKEGVKTLMVCPNLRGLYKFSYYISEDKSAHILEFNPFERMITYKKIK